VRGGAQDREGEEGARRTGREWCDRGGGAWQGEKVPPEHHELVSVYFSDIVGFTTISSTITSAKVSCQPALPRDTPQ
jgi:class 3 adenylate cyclase